MKKLLESYAGNISALNDIIAARAALVDLHIASVKYSIILLDDKNAPPPIDKIDAAREGVNLLNEMCAARQIPPVFTGDVTNVADLTAYAKELTRSIAAKMLSG